MKFICVYYGFEHESEKVCSSLVGNTNRMFRLHKNDKSIFSRTLFTDLDKCGNCKRCPETKIITIESVHILLNILPKKKNPNEKYTVFVYEVNFALVHMAFDSKYFVFFFKSKFKMWK